MKHPCPGLTATLDSSAPIASIDYETYYDAKCSIKELGAWAYCRHPDWEAYLITSRRAEFVNGAWLKHPTVICHPSEFRWELLHGHRIYSHNAGFDQTVFRREVELGNAPADFESKIEGWDCTADFGAFFCNRRSLADVVLFLFGRKLDKSVRDDAKGKRWANFTAEEKAKMLAYGGTDADECLEIALIAQEKFIDTERLLSRLNRLQGMRGVQIDVPKLELYLRACRDYLNEILRDIPWSGQINPKTKKPIPPTSTTAYCQYCRDKGIPTPPVKATAGEEAYLEWEAEHADDNPVIKAVSTYRSVNKFVGQLETLKERIDENGIYRFSLKFFGAHTGRFSGDAGFNMQNILKADANDASAVWIITHGEEEAIQHVGPVNRLEASPFMDFVRRLKAVNEAEVESAKKEGRKPKTKTMPGVFIEGDLKHTLMDMRSLFIPRKGRTFVIADSSQIEPRCLAFLTNDRAFIDMVKQGIDIYEAHARQYFGFTGPKGHLKYLANEEKKTEFITMRARAKAERLGLGYQAGPKGYQKAAALLAGLVLTPEEALNAVKTYRAASPNVVGYWDRLQTALTSSLGRTLRLRLPSGRIMSYRDVKEEPKLFVDPDTGKTSWKKQLTAETDGRRHGFYGGKLTENMCQAVARDVFGHYILMVWEAAYQKAKAENLSGYAAVCKSLDMAPLYHVHDEMICEAEDELLDLWDKTIQESMNSTPEYMGDTPFACEAVRATQYLK